MTIRWIWGAAFALIIFAFASVSVAQAQADAGPDLAAWTAIAERAEDSIVSGRASDEALNDLRKEIVTWRERFLAAQGQNSERIATLQAQIEALGPKPDVDAGAAPEGPDVAARREQLNEQLAKLRGPVVAAEEDYSEADGLIREIDVLLRERAADRLMELGPSPLSPARWVEAVNAVSLTAGELIRESAQAVRSDVVRNNLLHNFPVVLLFLALGLILIFRGRRWITRLVTHLRSRTRHGSGTWSFLASLGQVIVPLAGLFAIVFAVQSTGLIGTRAEPLIQGIPVWGATILLVWWLGDQVFLRSDRGATGFQLPPERRAEGRLYTGIAGLCLATHDLVTTVADADKYSAGARIILEFPVLVLAGFTLIRLGQILNGVQAAEGGEESTEPTFSVSVVRVLGRVAIVIGLIGPVMMAVGYGAAGRALVYPAISSLLLFGLLYILQRLIFDIYHLIAGDREAEQGGLIPVLAGFALSLASLPVLALLWGARVADLTELWARFQEGFAVGDSRISPTDFLTFVIIFLVGYMATRLLQGALRSTILPKTRIDTGGQTALVSGVGYVGIFLAALFAITSAGIDLTALGYVAGALSVGIGFGLQNIVSNFISGIILLVERPISEGDWIAVGGEMGYVRDISVRSTRIETFDRTDVIVPNSDFISGTVVNYTRGNTIGRVIAPVGVAYGTDTRKVEEILLEIANAHPMILATPVPNIVFRGFGADSLDFEIRAILRDVNWVLSVHSDLNHEIARRFAEEGIEIPFAQRDVWLRNPETLRQGVDRPAANDTPEQASPPGAKDTPEDDT